MMSNKAFRLGVAVFLTLLAYPTFSQENCGDVFKVSTGPWDYNDPRHRGVGEGSKNNIHIVERRHFTENVRQLVRGESSTAVFPDIAYTLNHIPNHYKALMSLINYDLREEGKLPQLDKYPFSQSVNCYFKRALQFRPGDPKLLQLYGIYFYKNGEYKDAISRFEMANIEIKSPELDYNIGLAYFELGELEKAKLYAQKAYNRKFPLPGLKNKLGSKGVTLEAN